MLKSLLSGWKSSTPKATESVSDAAQHSPAVSTRFNWTEALGALFQSKSPQTSAWDGDFFENFLENLETLLLKADVGVETTDWVLEQVKKQFQKDKPSFQTPAAFNTFLRQLFEGLLQPGGDTTHNALQFKPTVRNVYLVVGVNGAGKTTLIGKLAHRFTQQGQKVVIGAGDTFRAAATDQLAVWAKRANATFVGGNPHQKDAAAVVYEALQQAKNENANVVLLDTAGRLQNKYNLMEELQKIRRVIDPFLQPGDCFECLLVLDATTGQNALSQAKLFNDAAQVTGVALTKLDGSAKGGMVLAIAKTYGLPVKLVGTGEKITDLAPFEAARYLDDLLGGAA